MKVNAAKKNYMKVSLMVTSKLVELKATWKKKNQKTFEKKTTFTIPSSSLRVHKLFLKLQKLYAQCSRSRVAGAWACFWARENLLAEWGKRSRLKNEGKG
jgi:hypothetical protein